VSGNGAFEDEMDLIRRHKPEDDELAAFSAAVRATLLEHPDRAATRLLVPRLAEEARAAAQREDRRAGLDGMRVRHRQVGGRWWPALRVGIAIALVPLLSAGLAVAGVKLPGPADEAFESIGVELPNQAASDDENGGGTSAEDGEAEEPAASQGNAAEQRGHGKSKTNPAREGGRANGTNGRGRALGKRGVAPGQLKPKKTGGGQGNAVGQTGATPPGQAKDKAQKGSSGGGSAKGGKKTGHAKGKGK
jgi:hypothetical protein